MDKTRYRETIKKYIKDFQESEDRNENTHKRLLEGIIATPQEKNNISTIAKCVISENYEGIIQAIMGEYVSDKHMDVAIDRAKKKTNPISNGDESASSQSSDSSQSTASSGFSDFVEGTPDYMRDLLSYRKLGGKKTKRRSKSNAKKNKRVKKSIRRYSKRKTRSKTYKK